MLTLRNFFFLVEKTTNIDQTMKKNKSYLKVTLVQKGEKKTQLQNSLTTWKFTNTLEFKKISKL